MSMTDLFGSDIDESDEEVKSENTSLKEQAVSSDSEQSEQEDAGDNNNDDDEEDDEEENEEEEDDKETESNEDELEQEKESEEEMEERVMESDEESNNEQGDSGDNDNEGEQEEEEQESEKEDEPSEKHKNVSSLDLFGEDVSSEEDEAEQGNADEDESRQRTNAEQATMENDHQDFSRSDGEDNEEEKPEETKISIEIPYSKFSLGSELAFVKLPNFLSVETKPFVAAHYEDEIEEDDVLDEEGRARMKLRVENTIRWRRVKDEDGNDVKESNARIVTWSDGTMSLLLGGEVFDIHKTKIDGEHNHLFVQQGTGLQAQAIFHEKLTFRPHSTNSQTHRKMTLSIADRVSKAGKIKILPVVGKDPESQKGELIKKEEEKLRAQLRRENQQRRMRERSNARGLTASYLEPDRYDDEEDALEQSLLEMKRQYKKDLAKGRVGDVYSDQESEDGIVGGLESDDDESGETLPDKKSSDDHSRSRKHSFEESVPTKKRRKVIESDGEESD